MTERQDGGAGWVAGRGHLRASDADRERVIEALKVAFVQGRLSKSELVRRAGQALESTTYAELADATAYIPSVPRSHRPAPQPRRPVLSSRRPAAPAPGRRLNRRAIAGVLGIVVLPGLGTAFVATYFGSFYVLLLLGCLAAAVTCTPRRPGDGRHSVLFLLGCLAAAVSGTPGRPGTGRRGVS